MMHIGVQNLRDACYIEVEGIDFYGMYFYRRIGFYTVIGKMAHTGSRGRK